MKLFTKSYIKDFEWLTLAATSVSKLCKEPVEWHIVCERNDLHKLDHLRGLPITFHLHAMEDHWPECQGMDGYQAQQWIKMTVFRVVGDDYVLNWDSDVIAVRPFGSYNFIGKSGRPIYWFSQFNALMGGHEQGAHEGRMRMMCEVLQLPRISFEWMRCMPIWLHGQILRHAATQPEWQRAFHMAKTNDRRLSEFNIIGEFCHQYYPDAFEYRNAENSGPTWAGGYFKEGDTIKFQEHVIVSQGWSWGQMPEELRQFVNNL